VQTEALPSNETQTEIVEEVTNAAVEIAQIEADRDITIHAIAAETDQARIEASEKETELWHDQRLASMQERAETAERERDEAKAALALLTLPASEATGTEEPEATIVISTSETPTEVSSETQTEAPAKSEEEKPEAEVVAVVKRKVRFL
jgi:hypothetical protein